MKLKFHATRQMWTDGIELAIAAGEGQGLQVAKPLIMEPVVEEVRIESAMVMDIASAQSLMDELWHVGLRPSEGSGSAGSLAATERHLQDMRRLVFAGKEGGES